MLPERNPFQERMSKLDDKELLDVIKNGTEYQKEAVESAIHEAIFRNLITSEEGEKLLDYTIESIDQQETEAREHIVSEKRTGTVYIITGIITLLIGIGLTFASTNRIWIASLIVGTVMIIRGIYKKV